MAQNIEIKARAWDSAKQKVLAGALADSEPEYLQQRDVFFQVPKGRLKLRYLTKDYGQLITYCRSDTEGPKTSRYHIVETHEPAQLEKVLSGSLAVRGMVVKQRIVFLAGQTRIHLDTVKGLGHFLELEVVLRNNQSLAEGRVIAESFMNRLKIRSENLVKGAYIDMLER